MRKFSYDYIKDATTSSANDHREAIKPLLNHCENAYELTSLLSSMKKPVGGGSKIEQNCHGYAEFMKVMQQLSVSSTNCEIMEPFIKAIFSLAKEWRDDYVAYKKRKHIISYNDMERLFLHLITEKEEVIAYIRDNYRLVMVDEFQDSNPIQLKIFNRLSEIIAESDGHSYWVGDPKQAIYGFRGADTDLVNSVSKHFKFYDDADIHPEEGEHHLGSGRLVESWRSRPSLVNLVSDIFKDKFQGEIDPLCITLKPHFTKDDLVQDAIVHWHNSPIGKQKNTDPDAIAWKVKELLESGMLVHSQARDEEPTPIRPKDVAVLCRYNDNIKKVVKSMRKFNIPVSETEDAIMQRIEVQLVVTLLQFIQNPKNKYNIANLMRLLWGETTEEILRQRIDYIWEKDEEGKYIHFNDKGYLIDDQWMAEAKEVLQLIQITERFKHLSIPEMVRGIIYECNLPALVAKWGDTRIRQQNLSTVQHLADDYDQMCLQMGLGTSISGFIYYLNSIEPDKERDNQSNTVKVFTYHGSKGLEWPVVIMNELDVNRLDPNDIIKKSFMRVREMVLRDQTSEKDPFAKDYYLHFFPNIIKGKSNPSDSMKDNIMRMPLFEQLYARIRGEEKRLLYVGMTRAKDFLYTIGISDTFKWLENIGIEQTDKNHVWGKEHPNACQDITAPSDDEAKMGTLSYELIQKPDIHSTYGKRYLSPSKLEQFEGFTTHFEWEEHGVRMDDKNWGKSYDLIGDCIHDIFAVYQKDDETNRQKALDIINGYNIASHLAGHIDAILNSAEWLHNILQTKFPQQADDRIEREFPFMKTLADGTTLRGEMDLLWNYTDSSGNKHCVLVDYKSFLGVNLHERTTKCYTQLSAYAKALKDAGIDVTHSLIYYPTHSKIHELK